MNDSNGSCGNCSGHPGFINPKQSCTTFLPTLLLIVGVIEGITSLVILSQRSLKQLPLRRSLLVLCASSLVLLLLTMPRYAIMCHLHIDIRKRSLITCLLHRAMTDTMLQLSATTVAFISLERCLAIIHPYIIPQRRAKVERVGLICISAFCFLFNSHYFFTIDKTLGDAIRAKRLSSVSAARALTLPFHCHVKEYYAKWVVLLMSFVQTYIPFIIILVTNIIIVRRLYTIKQKLTQINRLTLRVTKHSTTAVDGVEYESQENPPLLQICQQLKTDSPNVHATTVTVDIAESPIDTTDDIKIIKTTESGKDNKVFSIQQHKQHRSREAKVSQHILLITLSFILFNGPYECINLLLKYDAVSYTSQTVYIWYALVYITYCYQLLVFPIYIICHPIIRGQVKAWFESLTS